MEHKVYQDDHAKKGARPDPWGLAAIRIISGGNFNGIWLARSMHVKAAALTAQVCADAARFGKSGARPQAGFAWADAMSRVSGAS
jgi:hypothetical protein